jgi:predicted transcriptional regulator
MEHDNQIKDEKYLIFNAAQALRNPYRQEIFTHLTARNNLSFNEILNILKISRSKLAYHLQIMIENNIITNFYDKRAGVKDHSFYELSAFGQELRMGTMGKMVRMGRMSRMSRMDRSGSIERTEGIRGQMPDRSKQLLEPGGYKEPTETKETKETNKLKDHKDMDKSITEKEASLSASFRTIRHPEFKKYGNVSMKLSKKSIAPIKKEKIEYIDPFLNVKVIKKTGDVKERRDRVLPTPRQFYIMHKQPFKNKNNIKPKY